jgi:glycosyltransferase involved in cell wall biosynthesis
MDNRVLRLGYVDDAVVPALLRRASAVAYPSLDEGFGLPALEALACGAALVTTSGSAMEDVVEDAALLVHPGDEDGLVAALERLVAGGPDVDRLRARGPVVAAAHTWARSAEQHVEAYHLATR